MVYNFEQITDPATFTAKISEHSAKKYIIKLWRLFRHKPYIVYTIDGEEHKSRNLRARNPERWKKIQEEYKHANH